MAYVFGGFFALFGVFIAFQTTTLRFTFDDTNFALVKSDLSTTGENVVVGGENVWRYDKFVNWDFFPSESFPILVYFKETQTPKEFWNVGPGEQANSEEVTFACDRDALLLLDMMRMVAVWGVILSLVCAPVTGAGQGREARTGALLPSDCTRRRAEGLVRGEGLCEAVT